MRTRSAAFDAAVRALSPMTTRVYSLDRDLAITSELTGYTVSGQVALDRGRGSRSMTMAITSADGALVPETAADVLFPDNRLMIQKGYPWEMVDLGIFAVERPESSTDSRAIAVTGSDRWKLGAVARFPRPIYYTDGTPVGQIVRELAILAGMGDYRFRLDDAGQSVSIERTFLPNESIVTAMKELAADHALRVRVEADWTLDLRPVTDPATASAVWEFAPGADAILTGASKGLSSPYLFNAVPVAGSGPGQEAVFWESEVEDPGNPAHKSRIGYRPAPLYESPLIVTVEQARDVSLARLPTHALITADYALRSLDHPCIEDDDVVRLDEPYTRSAATLWLDGVTHPLAGAEMTLSASELVALR